MKPFIMVRSEDVSGISGTGVVAEGVEFSDGSVVIRWQTENGPSSTVMWESIEDAIKIHGHGGKTRFVFFRDEHILYPEES